MDAGPPTRLVVETFDTSACADWDLATHLSPDLPPDVPATPEILWDWSPLDDPMLAGLGPGLDGYEMLGFSISPEGGVWLRTPTETDLTLVRRDGQAVFHVRLDDPLEHWTAMSIPVVAPDGTAFVMVNSAASYLAQYSPAGPVGRVDVENPVVPSIGPRGRVWLAGDEYCRLRRMRSYTIEHRFADGTMRTWSAGGYWIEPEGAVAGGGIGMASRTAIEVGGTLGWRYGVEPREVVPRLQIIGVATAAGNDAITTYVAGATAGEVRLVSPADETVVYREATGSADLRLDPTGVLRRFPVTRATVERVGVWPARETPCTPEPALLTTTFAADGTFVCVNRTTGVMSALSPADGSVIWELRADPADPDARFFAVVGPDLDGRLYAAMQRISSSVPHLVAIQTNLRPPGDGYCHEALNKCNRHHNGWAHDYRPAPAAAP